MSASFSIRPAIPGDVPLILSLIRALAVYERLEHQVVATDERLLATLFGPEASAETILLEVDGDVVAFALFFPTYSTFLARPGLHLEDLFVKPEFRGRGYGKALLQYLARLAVERGCGRFEWRVLDWNESAIRFYRGQGAEVLADWRICRVTGQALVELAGAATAGLIPQV